MTEQDTKTNDVRIDIDFRSDWNSILKTEIQSLGYIVDPTWDERTTSDAYFNIQRLLIGSLPRNVLTSRDFSCPSEFVTVLESIKSKARKGESLRAYQSRNIENPLFNDALLNDWDIHHLHLGKQLDSDGFVARTGPVLFVRVTHDTFYLLDVMRHGPVYQPWIKKKLVRVIHEHWPDSIAVSRLKWVVDLEVNPSEQAVGQLRKAGIVTMLKMDDGTIYGPIGGGYSVSGTSLEVVEDTLRYFRLVDRIEEHCKENASEFMIGANTQGHTNSTDFHIELLGIGHGYASVLEQHTGTRFRIPLK